MSSKAAILEEIARSRAAISRDVANVRSELDLTKPVKRSVGKRPFVWLGGAAAVGYMLAGPKTKTKTIIKTVKDPRAGSSPVPPKKSGGLLGFLISVAKFLFPIVRPALTAFAVKHISTYAERLSR